MDRNRTGSFGGTAAGDQILNFGQAGDVAVTGDWSGSGTLKIGVFRGGQWLLDYNGNGVWDGVFGGDLLYTFGQAGDKPVVGDWNGSGVSKIGVFRSGFWMLDLNGTASGMAQAQETRGTGSAIRPTRRLLAIGRVRELPKPGFSSTAPGISILPAPARWDEHFLPARQATSPSPAIGVAREARASACSVPDFGFSI